MRQAGSRLQRRMDPAFSTRKLHKRLHPCPQAPSDRLKTDRSDLLCRTFAGAFWRTGTADPLLTMEAPRRRARSHAITRDTILPANSVLQGREDVRDVARVASDVSVLCPRLVVGSCNREARRDWFRGHADWEAPDWLDPTSVMVPARVARDQFARQDRVAPDGCSTERQPSRRTTGEPHR